MDLENLDLESDGLQVYMDVLARRVDGRVFGNMNGFAVCPDLESQAAIEQLWDLGYKAYLPFGDDYVPLSKQGSFITGTGYTIEIALPWKGLAFAAGEEIQDEVQWVADNVTTGLEIALALQMNVADQTGARTNAVNWLPEGGYSNSGNWGGLELAGAVGSETSVAARNLNIYPSVTNGLLYIEMQNLKSVEIIDVSGKVIFSRKVNSDQAQLHVSSFQKGLYILKANDGVTHFVNKFIRQ